VPAAITLVSMEFRAKKWTVPQSSLKLGDRLLLVNEGGGCEGEL
jgi:hypothetical protein